MMNYKAITKKIRSITKVPKSNDRECYMDGSKRVENHHLYRVADLGRLCVESGYLNDKNHSAHDLYIPLVDMNHKDHFSFHVLAEHSVGNIEITPDKIDKFYDLLNEMKPLCGKVPEELLDQYIDLHMDMCETIEKNIELTQSKSINEEMKVKEMFDNDVFWGADRIPKEDEEITSMEQIYFTTNEFDLTA